ncbi:hypothetical protein BUALT_Bualt10G0028800 [Buddleja alternifolia]|uniref:Uncharacterized protein n=1 Tax=Buddleja alternifolia TaxID=168488 RepID=A0AAV6X6C0_9LAMI|nr:hypothetical protein BUALT_Bualt10G0028800 [Buddleja alternifolia]
MREWNKGSTIRANTNKHPEHFHNPDLLSIRYPSALNSFHIIMDCAKNRKLMIFLDYDGTLSPIVDDPDRAFISSNVRIYPEFNICCELYKFLELFCFPHVIKATYFSDAICCKECYKAFSSSHHQRKEP